MNKLYFLVWSSTVDCASLHFQMNAFYCVIICEQLSQVFSEGFQRHHQFLKNHSLVNIHESYFISHSLKYFAFYFLTNMLSQVLRSLSI